jgi:MFS family permease
MVLALLCVAQFVVVLDVTIVAIALPAVQADLGLSTVGLGWVITGYTLVFGGCVLAAGRLADRAGRRRVFVAGLILFAVASLACGLAPTGGALLGARAVQGLGAALVAPAALALLTAARPADPARSRALGWWTAAAAGGGASGWVLGGLLSGLLDWRWVFLVNVPVCAVAAVLAPRVLSESRDPSPARGDLAGAVLATAGLAALVLALTLAAARGPTATATLGALAGTVVLLAALAIVEAHAADPLVDRALLRRRGVAGPNAVAAVLTAATTPPMLLCTLHAQHLLGLAPATAGLRSRPSTSRWSRARSPARAWSRPWAAAAPWPAGCSWSPPARWPCARSRPDPAVPSLVGGFVLLGAGLGVASVASTAAGTAALDGAHQDLASGLLSTSAQVGTAVGLAVVVPLASARTDALGGGPQAEVAGFELGFTLAAALAGVAAVAVLVAARRPSRVTSAPAGGPPARGRISPRRASG